MGCGVDEAGTIVRLTEAKVVSVVAAGLGVVVSDLVGGGRQDGSGDS